MILDTSYFYIPIEIPQISTDAVANTVTRMISIYEPEFLTLLLGKDLYDAFKAGLTEDPVPAKWTDLKNKLFITDPVKISPAANYVYFKTMRQLATASTGSGEKNLVDGDSSSASSQKKVKEAWNEMVKMNEDIINWLDENEDTYPDWDNFSNLSYARVDLLTRISYFF